MDNGMLRMVIMQLRIDKRGQYLINVPIEYRSIQWANTIIPNPETYFDAHSDNIEKAMKTYNQLLLDKNKFDIVYLN